ncbi:hypothetical protein RJ640_012253, partial [Escallonia rubra]
MLLRAQTVRHPEIITPKCPPRPKDRIILNRNLIKYLGRAFCRSDSSPLRNRRQLHTWLLLLSLPLSLLKNAKEGSLLLLSTTASHFCNEDRKVESEEQLEWSWEVSSSLTPIAPPKEGHLYKDRLEYFELPYGNVLSSLFSGGKVQLPKVGSPPSGDLSQNTKVIGYPAPFDGLNSTGAMSTGDIANNTKINETMGIGFEDGVVSERNQEVNDDSLESDEESDPVDGSPFEDLVEPSQNSNTDNGLAPDKARESALGFSPNNIAPTSENIGSIVPATFVSVPSSSPSPSPSTSPAIMGINLTAPLVAFDPNSSSSLDKYTNSTVHNSGIPGPLQGDLAPSNGNSSVTAVPAVKERSESPTQAVLSISNMNDILLQSRAVSHSMKPRWSSQVDKELQIAKSRIEDAPIFDNDRVLYAPLYRNVSMFKRQAIQELREAQCSECIVLNLDVKCRSYELMEQTLKVYIYREGERPIFHLPVLKGIYASEGWFMKQLKTNKHYVTKNPRNAHLFYLPFSSRMLEETLYVPGSHSRKNLVQHLKNYLDMIVSRYPFWNRTGGADHFLVACHDWVCSTSFQAFYDSKLHWYGAFRPHIAPAETEKYLASCIRALCNSDIKEGFKLGKDVSLPETNVRTVRNPLKEVGGNTASERPILAFFAGKMHGYVRPILLQQWENKDPDMKIFKRLPKSKNNKIYSQHMKSSKYCICAKGYEVNSPRVVEAIFFECVPVIISDNFVPPFFEILDWESFAVFVQEKDIPNLKSILLSISERRYLVMQQRVKQVQQHFLWHSKPVKYDIFHMILHSIWYNRVFQQRP